MEAFKTFAAWWRRWSAPTGYDQIILKQFLKSLSARIRPRAVLRPALSRDGQPTRRSS